ncbi:hypothetical protein QBC40DRAFT_179559 [Triangularia verruculosa]|uniref:Uncharacterized protein n=1 Tax=Triangularia verruculosa TaxID=2587418 RepID=A0AAN6XGA1_9PEZI|nr:hypothetical protein QBC40DRAFT_179559 [Triangularia verruculosa]
MSVAADATVQEVSKPATNGKPLNSTKPEAQNESKIQKESNSKRKRQEEDNISDFRVCERCQSSFFEKDKMKGVCQWHPEELEVDDESHVWFDWDPRCHGPRDTEYNRREYPDGFLWVCCEGVGSEPGCKTGKHRAKDSKRGRYESDSESDTEEEEEDSEDYEDHYDEA